MRTASAGPSCQSTPATARCNDSAQSTAVLAREKAAAKESPAVEKMWPSKPSMTSVKIASCIRSDAAINSGSRAQSRVDPTTSEKRNVTIPVGAVFAMPDMATAYVRVFR